MQLEEVRAFLQDRRGQLTDELAELTKPPEAGSNVSFGKRIGEGTTEAVERISSTAAARSIAAALAEADRALKKVDERTYGMCDDCGRAISSERLEAMPSATLCVTCSARAAHTETAEGSRPLSKGCVRGRRISSRPRRARGVLPSVANAAAWPRGAAAPSLRSGASGCGGDVDGPPRPVVRRDAESLTRDCAVGTAQC